MSAKYICSNCGKVTNNYNNGKCLYCGEEGTIIINSDDNTTESSSVSSTSAHYSKINNSSVPELNIPKSGKPENALKDDSKEQMIREMEEMKARLAKAEAENNLLKKQENTVRSTQVADIQDQSPNKGKNSDVMATLTPENQKKLNQFLNEKESTSHSEKRPVQSIKETMADVKEKVSAHLVSNSEELSDKDAHPSINKSLKIPGLDFQKGNSKTIIQNSDEITDDFESNDNEDDEEFENENEDEDEVEIENEEDYNDNEDDEDEEDGEAYEDTEYNINHDHWYDDVKPKLQAEKDIITKETVIRIIIVTASCIGAVLFMAYSII